MLANSFTSSSTAGLPQICAGWRTSWLPAAISAAASRRWTLRLVGSASPYSKLKLAKPFVPIGKPKLPATL